MIDDALEILDYLPDYYKTQIESDYIIFLKDAFEVNYNAGKYQFAYIAYHMLFMCFVYFQLVKIYQCKPDELKNIMLFTDKAFQQIENHENELRKPNTTVQHFDPFKFAKENERGIMGLFLSIGCKRENIKKMKYLVDERNNITHSNGQIVFQNQDVIDAKIKDIMECVECIYENSKTIISVCTEKFLLDSANPDEREFPEEENQVREIFVRGNYLSLKDMVVVNEYKVEELISREDYQYIEKLYWTIQDLYPSENDELDWDAEARRAVEHAMESAEWDEDAKTITFSDTDEPRYSETVTNREALELYLAERAREAFFASVPFDDGEAVFECDDESIVQRVLVKYEDQLQEFFSDDEE